eukprot:TRINITY_DN9439_c0_g1_i4.p1 TRINITY_DN9439_c0_g1~~TRINITY_DN9439_c0_g1_i4.p1  ORF type:complete len:332 (-),score=45.84 TRINITY_DN9439_c0_g1_i4:307-1302(-)
MEATPLRVLEFYSGIGGMHYALQLADSQARVISAFDVNDVANRVYALNFGSAPCPSDIRSLTTEKLRKLDGDVYLMCPPCQPYTRLGKKLESKDPRASSFLHILELMPHLAKKPRYLAIENVKGFEVSDTHDVLIESLQKMGYNIREFLLSPRYYKIPNERTRYFLLARLHPLGFDDGLVNLTRPLDYIPSDPPPEKDGDLLSYVDTSLSGPAAAPYVLSQETLARYGNLMDIVYSDSKSTCCFTKGYGHMIEGTGSVFDYSLTTPTAPIATPIHERTLRYFTPREVANLHHFPADMKWPEGCTDKQKYRLLGNRQVLFMMVVLWSMMIFS